MKRISLILVTILLLGWAVASSAKAAEPDFDLHARGIYMVNTDSGKTVYSHHADEIMYPASLTSIMTALLALESVNDLSAEKAIVPGQILNHLYLQGASQVGLKDGEAIDMEDLVHALLLPSGCDAATVIAWYVGDGDVDAFVERMNRRAKELGALNTNFINPTGLHDKDQVTTPFDMYKISSYAMSLPAFREIVNKTSYTMKATNKNPSRTVYSTNSMMDPSSSWYDPRVRGIKSGYTSQAGRCMISTASDSKGEYLLVVMGANLDQTASGANQINLAYRDSLNLYDWGFTHFTVHRLTTLNEVLTEISIRGGKASKVNLVAGNSCSALLEAGENPIFIQPEFNMVSSLKAPVTAGQQAGKVVFTLNGEQLASVDLVTEHEVPKSWLRPILFSVLVIIAIALLLLRIRNRRQRKRLLERRDPRQYQDLAR